jgi:hypothetical protein
MGRLRNKPQAAIGFGRAIEYDSRSQVFLNATPSLLLNQSYSPIVHLVTWIFFLF